MDGTAGLGSWYARSTQVKVGRAGNGHTHSGPNQWGPGMTDGEAMGNALRKKNSPVDLMRKRMTILRVLRSSRICSLLPKEQKAPASGYLYRAFPANSSVAVRIQSRPRREEAGKRFQLGSSWKGRGLGAP